MMPQRRCRVERDERDQRPGEIGVRVRQHVLDRRLVDAASTGSADAAKG